MALRLVLSTMWDFLNERFRLVVFLVKIWFACDFEKINLPVPVLRNRFAAARFVFIFGIVNISFLIEESYRPLSAAEKSCLRAVLRRHR